MKKILYIILSLLIVVSCDKEDKGKPAQPQKYPILKYQSKVSKIEGKNKIWGEYKLLFYYTGEKLDSAWHINNEGDTVGRISYTKNDEEMIQKINVYDYVLSISQDSVQRMDEKYKKKYGEGNYSLKDSLPHNANAIFSTTINYAYDGRVVAQEDSYYVPRENVGTSGVDFDNSYILTNKNKYMYEYDLEGNIAISRNIMRVYPNKKMPEEYISTIYKYEMIYRDNKAINIKKYNVYAGENYSLSDEYNLEYSGNRIQSINGTNYKKSFNYSGQNLVINDNGKVINCEIDNNGNITKVVYDTDNYMKISYIEGAGEIWLLTTLIDRLMGVPFAK